MSFNILSLLYVYIHKGENTKTSEQDISNKLWKRTRGRREVADIILREGANDAGLELRMGKKLLRDDMY